MEASLKKHLSSTCEVKLPRQDSPLHEYISRWSDVGISLPAAIVTPSTEDDCIAAVHFAREQGLKLVPANGGHGSFVPIDNKTVYLDMKNFKQISLDKTKGSVTAGGGAITGDVLKACADQGYYTCQSRFFNPFFLPI